MIRTLALDLSLSATGWAVDRHTYGTIDPHPRRGPQRLSWVRDQILELEHDYGVHLVAIEGYSYNSRSSQAHSLGELGGVVRTALYDADIAYLDISPATVKKYATGKGNASKSSVLVNAVKRLGYDGDCTDEADALWIAATIAGACGAPWIDVPVEHRKALEPVIKTLVTMEGAAA